jgi:hypothetical protein
MATIPTSLTPSWSTLKRREQRRNRRYAVTNTILRVSWLDSTGQLKMSHAKVLNVCELGMAVDLPEAPRVGSMIRFQSEKLRLIGSATVRHARQTGLKFIVGLEFADGLRWQAPEGDVQEPIPLASPDE